MLFSLLDSNGWCVNRTVWDGLSDWQPPVGTTPIEADLRLGCRYEQNPETSEWVLVEEPPAPPPVPQWVAFGAALAADPDVNAMVATAATAAPVLHLMLGVGLGQAAQGDAQTFSAAWANARSAGLVSAELAAHVADLGAGFDLPAAFLAQLQAT